MNRSFAQFISLFAHPLLTPTYALVFLLLINPYAFGVRHIFDLKARIWLIAVFACSFLIPVAGALLLKPLGFIKDLAMTDKQDRTGPYIITGIFYLWLLKNLLADGQVPALYTKFVFGATIGLFLTFFLNIFFKISAHAVGMGGFVGMLLLTLLHWGNLPLELNLFGATLQASLLLVMAAGIALAGLVGTARLSLEAHEPRDVYRGYAVGFVAMLAGNMLA